MECLSLGQVEGGDDLYCLMSHNWVRCRSLRGPYGSAATRDCPHSSCLKLVGKIGAVALSHGLLTPKNRISATKAGTVSIGGWL